MSNERKDTEPSGPSFSFDIDACRRNLAARERNRLARREARRLQALEDVRRAVLQCAPRYPSIARVYLFGSVLRRGAFRTVSDVDVAVEGAGAADYFAFFRDLEEAAPEWTIDLRTLSDDDLFAGRVRATGMLVYERENPDPQS